MAPSYTVPRARLLQRIAARASTFSRRSRRCARKSTRSDWCTAARPDKHGASTSRYVAIRFGAAMQKSSPTGAACKHTSRSARNPRHAHACLAAQQTDASTQLCAPRVLHALAADEINVQVPATNTSGCIDLHLVSSDSKVSNPKMLTFHGQVRLVAELRILDSAAGKPRRCSRRRRPLSRTLHRKGAQNLLPAFQMEGSIDRRRCQMPARNRTSSAEVFVLLWVCCGINR